MDKSSFGNYYRFHSPTVVSSTKNEVISNPVVTGIPLFFISATNFYVIRRVLNSELKGPQYDKKAQHKQTLPTSFFFLSVMVFFYSPQRFLSPDSEVIKR